MEKKKARRWFIGGTVQGVGFRFFVQHKATTLGVSGWTKNLADGRVEVYAAGDPAKLDDLGAALYIGPRFAEVRTVDCSEVEEVEPESGFVIR